MALSSTVFVFEIDLADNDRSVYETLSLRVARHPSEADEFLIARVLAYCLEYTDGIEFSRGLSDAGDPPIAVRDLTGTLRTWIDVGTPSAERLHRAAKLAGRVAVYLHKDAAQWLSGLAGERIHRLDEIEFYALDRGLVTTLAGRLDRRMGWSISVADREIFVSNEADTLSGAVRVVRPGER